MGGVRCLQRTITGVVTLRSPTTKVSDDVPRFRPKTLLDMPVITSCPPTMMKTWMSPKRESRLPAPRSRRAPQQGSLVRPVHEAADRRGSARLRVDG